MNGTARSVAVALALVTAGAAFVSPAQAQRDESGARRVEVRVVDVSGGRAYLEPGETAGIAVGTQVQIGRLRLRVAVVTATHAAVDLGERRVEIGARGTARVRAGTVEGPARLASPTPLARFRGRWRRPTLPAERQSPRFVPIGVVRDDRAVDVVASLGAGAAVPLGSAGEPLVRAELRGRVHAEPIHEVPLALDADAAVQMWIAGDLAERDGGRSRPVMRVRQLELAYGRNESVRAALGRLRYAAATLGMLDGARVHAPPLGPLTLGAFGGFVPDPIDGRPAFEAARFGVELGYRDALAALRPAASLVAHGSTFEGSLDERRLSASLDLFPGASHAGARAELSLFDAVNPWNASQVELTAAGADASVRLGALDVGARIDLWRPERSRWLAASLPAGWLCTPIPQAPADPPPPEPCDPGAELRYGGAADATLTFGSLALSGGVTADGTEGASRLDQLGLSGRAALTRILGGGRASLSLFASQGPFFSTASARAEVGALLLQEKLDVSLHWRPALVRYEANRDRFVEHQVGADLRVWLGAETDLDASLAVDALWGDAGDALLVQTLIAWRPRF